MKLIKKLFCHHDWRFVCKLYGDEINAHDGKRYEYVCTKCGASNFTFVPISCQGCRHVYYNNDGSVQCDCCEREFITCISAQRIFFSE